MRPYLLALAAVPALLGSLLLLYSRAPSSLLLQQAVVAMVALLATLVAARFTKPTYSAAPSQVLLLFLAAALFVPLFAQGSDGPHRWLRIAGLQLYLAPVVLPLFLVLWHRAITSMQVSFWACSLSACLVAIALFAQPDAPQLTAFAVAAISILCWSDVSKERRVSAIAIAVVAVAASWSRPDPLQPVPYVEGVFLLAAGASYFALAAVVAAAALPVVALVWLASRHRSLGPLAVALYFAVLLLFAPTLTTPVPLLGFGAGPILGYFLVAGQAWRRRASAA